MSSPLGTPRGRYDEYSSKIFPQLGNQGLSIRRGEMATTKGDAEPAHTQPSTLFPTYDEVVNLTGLLETKVMSVSSGKQYSMRVK
jgi:hypothetical protein